MGTRVLLLFLLPIFFGFTTKTDQRSSNDPVFVEISEQTHRFTIYPKSDKQEVVLQGVVVGGTYQLSVIQDSGDCFPAVGSISGTDMSSMYVFDASANKVSVLIDVTNACSGPVYLMVHRHEAFTKPIVNSNSSLLPVITTSTALGPQQLIEDVLIGGGCFSVSGASFSGSTSARGTFAGGSTNIGLASGVILSSGPIAIASGPNNATGAGGATGGGSDPDLSAIANGVGINDAAVLEFDFEPTEPVITFRYVFASEEYCDYANTAFNDAFGFFISGPGINGPYSNNSENIAVIPGTATPVSINNVNHINNPAYYVSNVSPDDFGQLADPQCAGTPTGTFPAINEVQYDGYTIVLEATANVIPCETYHIKLAVGDASDSVFDSAVFLEENSFDAGGEGEVSAANPVSGDNHAYEDCDTGFFTFTRTAGDPNVPLTINFTVGGTATPGADYAPLPSSVTIPPGVNQIQIPISIVADAITEGIENILLILDQPCNCDMNTAEFFIEDLPPLSVSLDDQSVCQGLPVIMDAAVSGGVEPYFYSWSNGSPAPQYINVPLESGPVSVTVTDFCGQTAVATADVEVFTLEAEITGSGNICAEGDEVDLTIEFTGDGPWDLTYTIDGQGPFNINGITDNPFTLPATEEGEYEIVAIISGGCLGDGIGTATVTSSSVDLGGTETDLVCAGDANGSIDLQVNGNNGPYTYDWSNGVQVEDPANLGADTYTVTVTDGSGCQSDTSFIIDAPPIIDPVIVSTVGVDCDNPTGGSIDLEVSGGAGGYTYQWSNGDVVQDPTGLPAGTYDVVIEDINGCTSTVSATVEGDSEVPEADVSVIGQIDCINTEIMIDGSSSTSGSNISYEWVASGGGSIVGPTDQPSITVDAAGTYQLTVTNTDNGCFSASSVIVQADLNTPVADAGPQGELTCEVPDLNLNGNGSSSGPNISYNWSTTDGNITSATDVVNPNIDAPGTYTLVVTNTDNGCTDESTVVVSEDVSIPVADPGGDETIDCIATSVILDGSNSTAGPNIEYVWSTTDGNIISGGNTAMPEVDAAGTYQLLVLNGENGCVDSSAVVVDDLGDAPIISIIEPDTLTCNFESIFLDASGSSSGSEFSYQWSASGGGNIVDGDTTLNPLVDESGTYQLEIINNDNGCSSVLDVFVEADQVSPVADAGTPEEISCTDPQVILDGSGSTAGPDITYEWVTVNGGNIVSGENTATPTIDAPGTYQLTVINTANGCAASQNIVIEGDSETPVATATGPGNINCITPQVTINGSGSSIGPNYTYGWSTGNGSIVSGSSSLFLQVDGAGTYTLSVTNTNNDCVTTFDVTVGVDTLAPDANAAAMGLLTCTNTELILDGTGSSTGPQIEYQWSTGDGNIVQDDTSLNPTIDAPGTYMLEVYNAENECTNTVEVTVDEDVVIPDADAVVTETLNCAVTEFEIDGTASSQGANIVYAWDTPNGNVVTGDDTDSPTIDAPGTYNLEVTNSDNGCVNTTSVNVDQDIDQPVADPGSSFTLNCLVTTGTLDAGASAPFADLSFDWSTADGSIISGSNSAEPEVDAPGTYELIVTDETNFCTDTITLTIDEDITPPDAEAGVTFELDCNATALNLDGTGSSTGGNYSYNWSTLDGNIVEDETTLNPLVNAPGTYELTVVNNDNGCETTDLVDITQDDNAPEADAIALADITCVNNEVTIDGGSSTSGAGIEYTWEVQSGSGTITAGQGTDQATVDGAGVYQLTVLNTNNDCQSVTTVTVEENTVLPTVLVDANEDITCTNLDVPLEGTGSSTGPEFTYNWSTIDGSIASGQTSIDAVADAPGTYTLEVTNTVNGCINALDITVDEDVELPAISIDDPELLTCSVTDFNLDATASDQGPDFNYDWSTLDGSILSGNNGPQPQINAPGTYELTITNQVNGCVSTETVTVDEDVELPFAEAGPTFELTCVLTALNLDGTASDQGPAYAYQWTATNGGVIQSGATSLDPVITEAGTYTLEVTNGDNDCVSTDLVTITEDVVAPDLIIADPDMLTCIVEELNLNATGSDAGPNFEYNWSTVNGNIVDQTNASMPLVNAPGTYTLTIENTENGCVESLDVSVGEDIQVPGADAGPTFELNCNLEQVELEGSSNAGDASFEWTTMGSGSIVSGSASANPVINGPGTYSLTVTDGSNGCTSVDEVSITENNPEAFDTETIPPACSDDSGVIQFVNVIGGAPPYTYSIDGGSTFSTGNFYTALDPGTYDVAIQDANGCALLDEIILPEGIDVSISVEDFVLVSLGDTYQINALTNIPPGDIAEIIWSPTEGLSCTDCLNPEVTPTEQIDYKLTIKTEEGCESTEIISLRVDKTAEVFIPNAFSPDNDGNNDVFMIFAGDQVARINSFLVFDRWGESVYEYYNFLPNDPAYGWNGQLRGKNMNPGVFVYYAEIEFVDGRVELFEGDVTLFR
ncbi:MAG: hypothetical protein GYB31_05160 [Bacteroidetes bacterium]|nr:hypothetical protein [Bacteroidota bacterium]